MRLLFVALLLAISIFCAKAQDEKLKIYFECNESWLCDQEFMRNELPMVNFVRDRFLCDVQIINSVRFSGNGGETNTLRFIGQKKYTGKEDTLTYFNDVTATNDIKRKKMLKYMQYGLLPYMLKNGYQGNIDIAFQKDSINKDSVKTKDPWNYFQISIGSSGFFNGDRNASFSQINNSFTVSRETEKNKFNFNFNNNLIRNKFTYFNSDKDTTEIIKVVNDSQNAFAEYTLKLNQHWGIGMRSFFERSIFNNIDSKFVVFPEIEYSILPYKDYNTSRLILQYSIGTVNFNYKDTTIYLKTKESLFRHDIGFVADFTKSWGNISMGSTFTQYLHDFTKNNLYVGGAISWNIFKGFKFSMGGNLELIHDQLSLPKEDASRDDLLTQRRIIASSYQYFMGVGFSYTFGSIYNSQVHPAFRGLNWGINF